jgi:hypothetical protein
MAAGCGEAVTRWRRLLSFAGRCRRYKRALRICRRTLAAAAVGRAMRAPKPASMAVGHSLQRDEGKMPIVAADWQHYPRLSHRGWRLDTNHASELRARWTFPCKRCA